MSRSSTGDPVVGLRRLPRCTLVWLRRNSAVADYLVIANFRNAQVNLQCVIVHGLLR